jgi:hypothetical protein
MHRLPLVLSFCCLLLACNQPDSSQTDNVSVSTTAITPQALIDPTPRGDESVPSEPPTLPTISSASGDSDPAYREITWDDLMPEDYRPETILMKYMQQLEQFEDDDPKAMEVYGQIQAELENAPINHKLNGHKIKLPGFIAPLENSDGKVAEFLLVPYFGACIHVPPPPINQTVLVMTGESDRIAVDNIYDPIWVKGEISTEGKSTDIGEAGYRIVNARVEEYTG